MKYFKNTVFLWLLFVGTSCDIRNEADKRELKNYLEELESSLERGTTYVMLPLDACGPCFSEYTKLIKNHSENESVCFIFCTESSKKAMFLLNDAKPTNYLMDTKNLAMYKYGLIKYKPIAFRLLGVRMVSDTLSIGSIANSRF